MPADPYGAAATGPGAGRQPARASAIADRAGTAPGARAPRPGRRPDRRRRAGCRTSCAGSGATRRRRTCPAWRARPARSGSRRPRTPGRRPSCTTAHTSPIVSSNTPFVDGYVTMIAATAPLCASSFARRSPTSIAPSEPHLTTTTAQARPAPRWPRSCRARTPGSGRRPLRLAAATGGTPRIASRPASSPCEPAFGCRLTASYPVISVSASASSPISCR